MSHPRVAKPKLAQRQQPSPFRVSGLVAALSAATCFVTISPVYAADDKLVTDLQAEIAKLKQALEQSQKELAATKTAQTAPTTDPAATASPAAEPEVTASKEDTKELDTVVVRTRNRLEAVKDVPISISVVTGKDLNAFQARDLAAITQRAGNVSWGQGNARTSSLSIRGIGRQAQTDAMDPSVGVTVDGVSYAYNPLSSFDFYDIDTVEVARGPQGTLRGKNSTVGAITVNTKRPTFRDTIEYSLALGQNNRVIANTAVGGAVVDDVLAWRGSFTVDKGQGDWPNNYNADYAFKNKDNVSGRVQFLFTPTENFDALVKVEVTPKHEEYYNGWTFFTPTPTRFANGAINPLTSTNTAVSGASRRLNRAFFTEQDRNGYRADNYLDKGVWANEQRPLVTATNGASAVLNWRLAGHTLTSISAYKDFYFQARNDEGTPFDISKNGGGYVKRNAQYSQEFRISSDLGGKVDYQAGVYLLSQTNNYSQRTGYGADAGAWFASNAQYNALDVAGVNRSAGRLLLINSLSGLEANTPQDIETRHGAIYGQANWHISEPFTITSGLRLSAEHRENSSQRSIVAQGAGADLNPVSAGGFNAAADGTLGTNNAAQLALADSVAQKYYGVDYAALSAQQRGQIGQAKALRAGQIGTLYGFTKADTISKIDPTLLFSPSYKFSENVTGYVSFQYGEKGGIAQVNGGKSFNAASEKTRAYEVGFKSLLLNKTLTLNANAFLVNIQDYQQQVQEFDAEASALAGTPTYVQLTGNARGVRAKGVEVDGVYSGISHTNIRFAGAYNDAYYTDFKNLAQPIENNNIASNPATRLQDATGKTLPGAAKFTLSIGADYSYPVFTNKVFHAAFNTFYTTRYNSDVALSSYAWVPANSTTDINFGIGRKDRKFDASIVVKNLFNNDTSQVRTWNSYVPAVPTWVGVVFSGEL